MRGWVEGRRRQSKPETQTTCSSPNDRDRDAKNNRESAPPIVLRDSTNGEEERMQGEREGYDKNLAHTTYTQQEVHMHRLRNIPMKIHGEEEIQQWA
jgi:hypothetical protein